MFLESDSELDGHVVFVKNLNFDTDEDTLKQVRGCLHESGLSFIPDWNLKHEVKPCLHGKCVPAGLKFWNFKMAINNTIVGMFLSETNY